MASSPAPPLEAMKSLIQTTTSLITQLESYLHSIATSNPSSTTTTATSPSSVNTQPPPPPTTIPTHATDPFSLAHDSASLIRAHSTKLSLFIINTPFTPTAINKSLQELIAGPIPGIGSAVQLCTPERYTHAARRDLAWRCYRVLHELRGLIDLIPLDGRVLTGKQKDGGKGSVVSTGVVWAACDDVIALKKLGIAGLLVKKVEEYRDTLKDVLEELKEWGEEVEEESDGDDDDGEDDEAVEGITEGMGGTHLSAQQMIDDLMDAPRIPRNDPDRIRERLDNCLKRLRLTTLMYSAVVKRRIKPLAASGLLPVQEESVATQQDAVAAAATSSVAKRLDEVLPLLKGLPHRFGDVAAAFYDLDADAIDRAMDACFFDAFAATEMLAKPWEGSLKKDEFTEWAEKFQISIKKPD